MSADTRPVWWPTTGTLRGGLLGAIATASGMALTATSGWLIVRAAERPVILTLLTAIVMVRAFGMARPVFRYWERLESHDAALGLLADRRTAAYEALIPLTPARLGRRRRSDVLTGVVDDLTDAVDAQVRVTVPVISTVLAGGLAIALTMAFAMPVGLVMLGLGVAVALISALAAKLESGSLPALLAARAEVTRVSELVASQSSELRAVGGWTTAMTWLDDAHTTLARSTHRVSVGRALAASLYLVSVGAAVAATAFVVRDLDVATPVKALLLLTPVAVSEAVTPLVDAMRALARARGSESRIDALLDLSPGVTDPGSEPTVGTQAGDPAYAGSAVDLRGVTASWTGTRTDLAPTNLMVEAGTSVAVTGANGSGKSTLLAVLARQLDPASGTYQLGDADALDLPLAQARSQIAVVDDETHVLATTLRHNLTLARPDADDEAVDEALTAAGLGDLRASLPDGLDTVLGAGGRGLSGGERARLGIARAHLSQRPLVLLDEPVAHLDPPTARAVVEDLTSLTGRTGTRGGARTILMVTHRDDGADLFDRVVEVRRPASGTMSTTAAAHPGDRSHEPGPPGR